MKQLSRRQTVGVVCLAILLLMLGAWPLMSRMLQTPTVMANEAVADSPLIVSTEPVQRRIGGKWVSANWQNVKEGYVPDDAT